MDTYTDDLNAYRARLDDSLRAEDGWLALVGLFWLKEGDNTVGGDPACDVALPRDSVPARVGVIAFHDGKATLTATEGAPVTVDGKPVTRIALSDDAGGKPTLARVNSVSFFVIKRGDRFGIRARDTRNPARETFGGRTWFAPNPAFRVTGRFTPHSPPRKAPNVNIVGITEYVDNPGSVTFTLAGHTHTFEAFDGGKGRLWFVLRDATSGKTTYGASRFLHAPVDEGGNVDLDFNRAYNPPCAFTPYATCPLPPPENILPIAIEAGERKPEG